MPSKEEYTRVPLDQVEAGDASSASSSQLRESEELTPALLSRYYHPRGRYWRIFGPLAWLITTSLFGAVCILLAAAVTRQPTDAECTARLSVWSPAFEAVRYEDVQFQNSFSQKSVYRGKPTPELEQAWLDLWNFGPMNIPFEKLKELNKSTEVDWQRTKPESGHGVIGNLEVFHQLHCLDFIRQYTYRDQYDYSKQLAFDGTPEQVREHVDHCINSLRIHLQCASDVTPYLIKRDPRRPLGIDPDFNTQHKCRDFERIHRWAKNHELKVSDYQNDIS
ncbi:hypothetical protein QBC34DRAFT_374227 [Podospora aff. communis PSN243]|uniref:Cyclochlorotine biosynthesis protein O n=1 Tax=Podospora aff. communis PSN243 TaxID=3040156 RepID=A0AAV9H3V1_9PEZI|nr:hypothetical protein QBC34DRAFT_374227 [Podospora aff. communis PSN243]